MNLTMANNMANLYATLVISLGLPVPHWAGGLVDRNRGTRALCQSWYTAFFMRFTSMVGVLESRKARRPLCPVYQSDTFTARRLVASCGGFNPQQRSIA
jgi:hypothetical protein